MRTFQSLQGLGNYCSKYKLVTRKEYNLEAKTGSSCEVLDRGAPNLQDRN